MCRACAVCQGKLDSPLATTKGSYRLSFDNCHGKLDSPLATTKGI